MPPHTPGHNYELRIMNYDLKILALDMDGTLLDSEKRISERNFAALREANDKGMVVVPTTGRFFNGIPSAVRDLPFIRYAITINGAQVYDRTGDVVIAREEIPSGTALALMEYLDNFNVIYDAYIDNWGFINRDFYERVEDYVPDPHYISLVRKLRTPVDNLKDYVRDGNKNVQKILLFAKNPEECPVIAEETKKLFPDIISASSTPFNLEFNIASAHKGLALKNLAEYLGYTLDNCMAIGDGGNDLTMIQMAGLGVAMENAIPWVRAAAKMITKSNDDDGVAVAIHSITR